MKKLMIAAFAVAFAAVAQAAAVTWGSGAITLHDGVTKASAGTVTAYLFTISSSAYDSYITLGGEELSKAIYADFGSSLGSAIANKDSVSKGNKANLVDPATYGAGSSVYAAILYVDNTDSDYFMGNVGSYSFESDSDATISDMAVTIGGDIAGGSSSTAWSTAAIPEPTSALMLLVGLAGLALRRKQA